MLTHFYVGHISEVQKETEKKLATKLFQLGSANPYLTVNNTFNFTRKFYTRKGNDDPKRATACKKIEEEPT